MPLVSSSLVCLTIVLNKMAKSVWGQYAVLFRAISDGEEGPKGVQLAFMELVNDGEEL